MLLKSLADILQTPVVILRFVFLLILVMLLGGSRSAISS